MADPLAALLARLEREKALLESVAESRTSAPDTAVGAVEIDDQLVVSTLIRLKAEHGAQRAIKPQHVRAALALARDPAFARDPSIKIEAARWAALGVPRGDARSRVKSYAASVVRLDLLKNVPKAQEAAPEARQAELEANYRRQYGHRWFEFMPKSLGGGYDASARPKPQTPLQQPAKSDAVLVREARQRAQVELAKRIAAPAEDAAHIDWLRCLGTKSWDEAALKRVCKANGVLCSSSCNARHERCEELEERLVSVREKGRPDPCPRCSAIVHLVDDDEGQLLECRRHLKRGSYKQYEPCGWSKRVTEANRSALLPWPLVDSAEGDLKQAREFAEECERADAKRARSDSAWDIYRTDRLTEDEIHNAASTALVHVPVLSGPVDSSAPVVVASVL